MAILKMILGLQKRLGVTLLVSFDEKEFNHSTFQGQAHGPTEYSQLENRNNLMRLSQIFAFFLIFTCLSNIGTLKADAYLRGFQALEQRDYKTALYYLSFSAANGDAKAHYNLGIIYREGLGVKKDDVQSLTHFIEAAESGHMLGNYAVGLAFLNGKGSAIDPEAAILYLTEAALLGHAISPVEIGNLYFRGGLIEKDYVSAHFWLSLAHDRNAPDASGNLRALLSDMNQKQKRQALLLQNKCKKLTLRQCLKLQF